MTFVDGASLLVKAGQGLGKLSEFTGRKVAVVSGTTTEAALTRAFERRSIDAAVVAVPDEGQGMRMLTEGDVDAYASDRLVLMGLALDAKGSNAFRLIDEDFSLEPYALALRRDDHDFRLAVNRSLAGLFRSGDIVKIYDTWLGALGRPGVLLSAVYILQAVPE
jgi:glutamate/aspartate transport system substrate-binding protein